MDVLTTKLMSGASGGGGGLLDNGFTFPGTKGNLFMPESLVNPQGGMTQPEGITFNSDGTKYFTNHGWRIQRYDLTTAWDLHTASLVQEVLMHTAPVAVNSVNQTKKDICINDAGTAIFFCTDAWDSTAGFRRHAIAQINLGTAWDLTTWSFITSIDHTQFGSLSQDGPYSIDLNPAGTYMIVGQKNVIHYFTLSTAWNLSSASYGGQVNSIPGWTPSLTAPVGGLSFAKPTGNKLYGTQEVYKSSPKIFEWNLSTNFDITTMSLSHSVPANYTTAEYEPWSELPNGIHMARDGSKLFIGMQGGGSYVNATMWYDLSTPYDFSSGTYTPPSHSLWYETYNERTHVWETSPLFSPDGTKLYVGVGDRSGGGNSIAALKQFNLSTAWDLSTVTQTPQATYLISAWTSDTGYHFYEAFRRGVEWSHDGTYLTFLANYYSSNTRVCRVTMSTPYDLSTAGSFVASSNVPGNYSSNLRWNSDGTKVFVSEYGQVCELTCSTPYDVANLTAGTPYNFGWQSDWFFYDNGNKLLFNYYNNGLYTFDLVAPYDITNSTFDLTNDATSTIAALEWWGNGVGNPKHMRLGDNDSKLYWTTNAGGRGITQIDLQ